MLSEIGCVLLASLFMAFSLEGGVVEKYLKNINIQYLDSGIENINCVYVINLENRPEKWIETRDALTAYGIHPNRVDAINGWLLSAEEMQTLFNTYPVRLRGGEIGCILSHISTLKDAHIRGYDVIWICEDDIEICQNPHHISDLISTLTGIDPKWDIFYTDIDSKNNMGMAVPSLGAEFRPNFPHHSQFYYIQRKSVSNDILRINQRFGAYSMIISKRGVEKILKFYFSRYLWAPYDVDIHYIPHIREYSTKNDLVSFDYKKASDTKFDIE